MTTREQVVAVVAPFELMHRTVGSSRYWYVRHAPTGKYAAMFDAAPCPDKVAAVKAKFLAIVADWPDMTGWDHNAPTEEEIQRVRGLSRMLERTDARTYRVTP